MNPIKQFKAAQDKFLEIENVRATHRAVYMALLTINNSYRWIRVFPVDFGLALAHSSVDKDTYYKALNFLNENGFFDFYEKGKSKYSRAKISLTVLYEKSEGETEGYSEGERESEPDGSSESETDGVSDGSSEHLIKHKTINNKPKNSKTLKDKSAPLSKDSDKIVKKAKEAFEIANCQYSSIRFKKAWVQLCELPKWSKKPKQSLVLALNQLSDYNEEYAIVLVENAISGNWVNLVYPNTPEKFREFLNPGISKNSSSSANRADLEDLSNRSNQFLKTVSNDIRPMANTAADSFGEL